MDNHQSVVSRFRTLVESALAGVIGTDEDGSVRYCSSRAATMFGYADSDVIGMKVGDLIVADSLSEGAPVMHRTLNATGQRFGGAAFPVDLTVVAVKMGASNSLVWIVREIAPSEDVLEDSVTHLSTRRFCIERLRELCGHLALGRGAFAVIIVGLEGLDAVNVLADRSAGDAVLAEAADRLRPVLATADFFGRLGGAEFCVLVPYGNVPAELDGLARSIADTLALPIEVADGIFEITPKIGIAIAPGDGDRPDVLLANAQSALDRAKRDAEATRFFSQEVTEAVRGRRDLQAGIRRALDEGEFDLDFLPLIDLRTNAVSGAEALLRWRHPELGTIPPLEFIPLAEESGLMVPIGAWVLREALRHVKRWRNHEHAIRVSVNVTGRQVHSPGFVRQLTAALKGTECRPEWLELELTERIAMHHAATVQMLLSEVRGLGVRIALDDFGTGYSSMAYLKSLPIDIIKIDRSFVSGLPHDNDDCSIVRAIVAFALCTDREVRAEGVASIEQAHWLRAEGCDAGQGFLFSKPIPSADFEGWLAGYRP